MGRGDALPLPLPSCPASACALPSTTLPSSKNSSRKATKEKNIPGSRPGKLPGLRRFGVSRTPDFLKRKFCQIFMPRGSHPAACLRRSHCMWLPWLHKIAVGHPSHIQCIRTCISRCSNYCLLFKRFAHSDGPGTRNQSRVRSLKVEVRKSKLEARMSKVKFRRSKF